MGDNQESAIWQLLRDREERTGRRADQARVGKPTGDLTPLYDALLGVLGATRHLVEVTEDIVRARRDRATGTAMGPAAGEERLGGTKIKVTYQK